MPNLLRKQRTVTDGAEIGPAKKQRFIDATKTLLDIANESSDAFPPLKSCLGGINALIKYYEGCKDVEDNLVDLVTWLNKLKGSVVNASAGENPEEADRRDQLSRSLEAIEKRSRRLLNKGKGAKILDKKQDSGAIVKLVEELRQAILLYQLSQQQSINNQVAQLASSFDAFLKLNEGASGIKEKIESSLARLGRLTAGGSKFGDKGESKRKLILFEALEGIKDELCHIMEQSSVAEYKENEADMRAVCELAEDVRDAVMEHQFAEQTAIYEQNCKLIDSADLSVLNNCRRAQAAEYRHGNRRGCLKGTRETVLEEIESWANDPDKSPVYWLNGLAGTGKTTIAQTIAERLFAEGRLGASFFCSRDFEDRSNLHSIFPTLACQLSYKYPEFRPHILSLLRLNPEVVHESLYSQMQKLISEPLQEIGVSTVIVIDALDECKDDEPSSAILSVLARFVEETPDVKFFITGRPEPRINTGFRLPLLADSTDVFVLHDVRPSLVENDIRIFFKHELSELAQRRQMEGWPSEEHINILCSRAGGFFVYAVATVKFLDSSTHLPEHRLDVILKLPDGTAPEGKTRFNSKTTLDSLYTSILQAAFSDEDPDVDSKVRTTLGTIVMVVNPLPPPAIATLTGLESKEVMLYLTLIQSLLAIGADCNQPAKPFHKSFPDFITDPSRCVDTRFYISPSLLHFELTKNCLRLMNGGLEQDLLSLPEYALNSDVKDLQTRIDDRVSVALQYACRSWHNHLIEIRKDCNNIIPYLRVFLETKFLAWLEVLSVLGDLGSASVGLEKVMRWLQEVAEDSHLLDTAQDCSHFATKFFEPINVSATHIYHSALELCPISSIVRKLYYDRCHGITRFPRVVTGTPDSWDPAITFSGKDYYISCTWSPCGRFIASRVGKAVEIRNQLTFELLTTLQSTKGTTPPSGAIAYSPDGRSFACCFSEFIVIWDIQTGGVAKEIKCSRNPDSLVWSLDGRRIGITRYYERHAQGVETYDVVSGAQLFAKEFGRHERLYLLARDKSIRIVQVVYGNRSVATYEVGLGSSMKQSSCFTPLSIRSFTAFSPSTGHVLLDHGNDRYRITDIQTSDYLLELYVKFGFVPLAEFSPDGSLFAYFADETFWVWRYDSGSYTRLGFYPSRLPVSSFHFSPTSPSLLARTKNILQVQHLSNAPPSTPETFRRYAAISGSGSRVATARESERTIKVIDLHSQAPVQVIDTGGEIDELVITGNVLLVVSAGTVTAWLVTGEELVDGVFDIKRVDRSDSIWSTPPPLGRNPVKFKFRFDGEGQLGAITSHESFPFIYHTETGDRLDRAYDHKSSTCPWIPFETPIYYRKSHLRYPNIPPHEPPPAEDWLISRTAMQEVVWVMDPEGRLRFWLPVEWRKPWKRENWHHDITTLFIDSIEKQPVIIKF